MNDKRRIRLWVVEMQTEQGWQPTVGVGLTREDAKRRAKDWKTANPGRRFRLARYEASGT